MTEINIITKSYKLSELKKTNDKELILKKEIIFNTVKFIKINKSQNMPKLEIKIIQTNTHEKKKKLFKG